jgi:hypothetical protein
VPFLLTKMLQVPLMTLCPLRFPPDRHHRRSTDERWGPRGRSEEGRGPPPDTYPSPNAPRWRYSGSFDEAFISSGSDLPGSPAPKTPRCYTASERSLFQRTFRLPLHAREFRLCCQSRENSCKQGRRLSEYLQGISFVESHTKTAAGKRKNQSI